MARYPNGLTQLAEVSGEVEYERVVVVDEKDQDATVCGVAPLAEGDSIAVASARRPISRGSRVSGAARLFVAIQFSRDVQTAIVDATGDLRSRQPAVRWVRQDQIHLTLRFLGSVSRHRIDGLAEHLWEATEQMGAFDLTLRGLGCFPNVREPAVLWVGIASAAELAETRAAVEDAVAAAGFAREARAFRPHVTIGRVRRGTPFADGFATELDKTRVEVGVRVTSIGLVESTLLPRGAVHREVRGFSLVDDMQIG